MQGTFTGLLEHQYKHFVAYRGIVGEGMLFDSAVSCFAVALLEIVFKYRGSLLGQDLLSRIEENLQAVNQKVLESENLDYTSALVVIENLKTANYIDALHQLEYYVTSSPGMIKAVIVWMKLNLDNRGEGLDIQGSLEALKQLAHIFQVGLEIVDREEVTQYPSISLYFDEGNTRWFIFYTKKFISDNLQLDYTSFFKPSPGETDNLINKMISILKNKSLSASSLKKLQDFQSKTPDNRVQALLSHNSKSKSQDPPSFFPQTEEKCLKCKKPLKSFHPFSVTCKSHPLCTSCEDLSSSCKTCGKFHSSSALTLHHILRFN
jgi:hypothetical protein